MTLFSVFINLMASFITQKAHATDIKEKKHIISKLLHSSLCSEFKKRKCKEIRTSKYT